MLGEDSDLGIDINQWIGDQPGERGGGPIRYINIPLVGGYDAKISFAIAPAATHLLPLQLISIAHQWR